MLRFDIAPVCSNAYRGQALLTFIISSLYVFTPLGWLSGLLAAGALLRGFVSPHYCLSYRLFSSLTRRMGVEKKVNAGSKMFADKIATVAASVMFVAWWQGWAFGVIPAGALMFFSLLDLTTGFCAACWAYTAWYRMRGA